MQWSDLKDSLNKPYFFFRPTQGIRRLWRKLARSQPPAGHTLVILPWGLPICTHSTSYIGHQILELGIYDLCVTEVLWRLLDPGETAIDAGANIGQMTSILAARAAEKGRVLSFEPHPHVYQELAANVALWQKVPGIGKIELYEMGLSNQAGAAILHVPSNSLIPEMSSLEAMSQGVETVEQSVSIGRLTEIVGADAQIGVMKIDVEGHELKVLQGASDLLTEGRLRDIVFEDLQGYPSPVTDYLEDVGYTILSITQGHLAIQARPVQRDQSLYSGSPPSYLATRDAPRAIKRLRKPGYQVLRNQRADRKSNLIPGMTAGVLLLLATWFLAKHRR